MTGMQLRTNKSGLHIAFSKKLSSTNAFKFELLSSNCFWSTFLLLAFFWIYDSLYFLVKFHNCHAIFLINYLFFAF